MYCCVDGWLADWMDGCMDGGREGHKYMQQYMIPFLPYIQFNYKHMCMYGWSSFVYLLVSAASMLHYIAAQHCKESWSQPF